MSGKLTSPPALFAARRLSTITRLGGTALLLLAVGLVARAVPSPQQPGREAGRWVNAGARDAIPGQYIVVFKPGAAAEAVLNAERVVAKFGGRIGFRYKSALVGFSAKLPPAALEALRAAPGVAWIEPDQKVSLNVIQPNPVTGLDRTSERLLQLDNRFTYSETGAGVNAYVLDTGILTAHSDFGGRASVAYDTVDDDGVPGNENSDKGVFDGQDCNGHGTHVAGTIGGIKYGIAKNVSLRAVRVLGCGGSGTWAGVIAGVDWVTLNASRPAVVNMSLGGGVSPAIDTAVTNSIASGITYVLAAGNNYGGNACNVSPARVPTAITVGAVNPVNDTIANFSNVGPCLDLFAPGVQITSAWYNSTPPTNGCTLVSVNPDTVTCSGTSMAAPHVAGVVAFHLQNNPTASPASVWGAIPGGLHYNNNVSTTPGWGGIIGLPAGSPNELLHWGSLDDGYNDGDPHITTVNGVRYDFQGAGEFVALRDGGLTEVQTRQTPVATSFNPGANPHTGLATCVSLNTAVAARVGKHRVTYQPNLGGVPDPAGLQLRVDGSLTTLAPNGLALAGGGRVAPSPGGGIRIDFPDGAALIATPGWWASQGKWFLNLSVLRTRASEGIMGDIAPGNWLPALPDGTRLGPKPASLSQRYADLNQRFADAWRVTNATSLFDYAPGTSTATFTLRDWPKADAPCLVPETKPAETPSRRVAQEVCRAYLLTELVELGEAGLARHRHVEDAVGVQVLV
jgi:hypothetical protein